jgi:hypothetical protein
MSQSIGQLNTITQPEFTDLVRKAWVMNNNKVELGNAARLFIYDEIPLGTGDTRKYVEVDSETFARLKREGENAQKANTNVGYEKILTVRRFAREIEITWEMRSQNRYPQVQNELNSLVDFCPQRMELDLTHRFTFSTSTSYTDMDGETVDVSTGDGLSLSNATHTLSASSTTYRNRVNGNPVFSQGALEQAEELMNTNIFNNFGQRRVKMFNMIVTGDDPTTCRAVRQVLNSTADVDAAHEGVLNYYRNKYEHVVLPNLATTATQAHDSTKKKWWFLLAAGQGMKGWQAYFGVNEAPNLKTPAPGNNGEDVHNDNWVYGTRCAYGIAVVSGVGFIASHPA